MTPQPYSKPGGRAQASLALSTLLASVPLVALDDVKIAGWTLAREVELRSGLQHGTGINFGLGAADDADDTVRTSLSMSVEPALGLSHAAGKGEVFGRISLVAASNVLDGEISGQFARSGDSRIDVNDGYVGWRNDTVTLTVGPQPLLIGDGLMIGDGVFDVGSGQGQYWVAPFDAWRNAAVLALDGEHLHADFFWLRAGGGFGDTRLYGANLETGDTDIGNYGVTVIDVYTSDNAFAYDGVKALGLRALEVPLPALPGVALYGEVVWQFGKDEDGGGGDNDGLGWYLEAAWTLPAMPWPTVLTARYSRFSGDDPDTPDNEGYRFLFYSFGNRGWDAFYQGEIAGEYHLFNSNQVTRFLKLRTAPHERFALTAYYYEHDLAERHFFGTPVASRDWTDEVNAGVEYIVGHEVYVYAGVAWSTPNAAARAIFGDRDFTVWQTWMSLRF